MVRGKLKQMGSQVNRGMGSQKNKGMSPRQEGETRLGGRKELW